MPDIERQIIPEAFVIFDTVAGHDHDGSNSRAISLGSLDHSTLANLDWPSAGHTVLDDVDFPFGTGDPAILKWETADPNANEFILVLPEGGATDVPVFVMGDASIDNVNLGFFNGITEPTFAVVNDAADAVVSLDAGDINGTTAGKGLNFKPAADEDVNLIMVTVTGGPTFIWDESETSFAIAGAGLLLDTTEKVFFRDSAIFINSSVDGQLDIDADTEVEITTTTLDINANTDISGTLTQAGNIIVSDGVTIGLGSETITFASTGNIVTIAGSTEVQIDAITIDLNGAVDMSSTLTIADNIVMTTGKTIGLGTDIITLATNQITIASGTEVQIDTTTLDINAATDISGSLTMGGNVIMADNDVTFTTGKVRNAHLCFMETDCGICQLPLEEGDKVVLITTEVHRDGMPEENHSLFIPAHMGCDT